MSAISQTEDFAGKLDSDLAARTFQGTWGHPATLVLVFFTTTLPVAFPRGFWDAAVAMTILILCRLPLLAVVRWPNKAWWLGKLQSQEPEKTRWRAALILNIYLAGAVWGLLGAYTCAVAGCESRSATLLVLYMSAIAGAGIHLLVQSVRLVAGYLVVILAPLAFVSVFQSRQGAWLAVAIGFYFLFLLRQAKPLHLQYCQQRTDNQELSLRARRDALTELPNRLAFQENLSRVVASARANKASVALLFIDLDGFKQINDRFSHRVGDLFLCEIARRLRSSCADGAEPFRLGGDEFTVLLREGTTAERALACVRRLQETLREPMSLEGNHLVVSASIGLSVFPEDCVDGEDLLRTADHAMYAAKAAGKGTHRVFREMRGAQRFSDQELVRSLRDAVQCGRFDVHYQPQVDSRGALAGLEALLRWNHPERGNIPPLEFIPLAEKTGLIVPLGFWILRHVCEQGVTWHREGFAPVTIAVNVSPVQLENPDFVLTLVDILRETGFPPSLLTIEITESTLLGKHDIALNQLVQVRDLGIRIAIDDFGTGYSALSRIGTLPVDVIKLDRTFVAHIQKRGDRAPIVEAILTMARDLHLDVIAEGIEQPEQYEVLSRMGCEMFQGYYFGKASRAESARHFHPKQTPAELVLEPAAMNVA